MNQSHKFWEKGLALGMLREQDATEDHFEFVLDAHQKLGIP